MDGNVGSNQPTSTGTFSLEWDEPTTMEYVRRECEKCNEEYTTLEMLADQNRNICQECAPPTPFENIPSVMGAPFPDEPLMEYGPHSEGRYG